MTDFICSCVISFAEAGNAITPVVIISLHTVYTFRFLNMFAEFDVLFESPCDSFCNIWPNLDILPTPTIATGIREVFSLQTRAVAFLLCINAYKTLYC